MLLLELNQINNFSFLYPEREEQVKISRFLASIDRQRDLINQQIEKSNAFKKGILQRIFI
jgi:type I restriction enzyme S subunit